MRALEASLVPDWAAGAVHGWSTDRITEDGLLPSEQRLVADAVPVRRAQFASARRCARAGLAALDLPATPILHDGARRPRWPVGVVGSLTHCAGRAAAVVASTRVCLGLGIDAEPAAPLPRDVLDLVLTPRERRRVAAGPPLRAPVETVVFSAKEAAFKIFSPSTGGWLDPEEIEVEVSPAGAVRVRLAHPLPDGRTRLSGRWTLTGGVVLTVLAAPASGRPGAGAPRSARLALSSRE